jgi:hypothetical protein
MPDVDTLRGYLDIPHPATWTDSPQTIDPLARWLKQTPKEDMWHLLQDGDNSIKAEQVTEQNER